MTAMPLQQEKTFVARTIYHHSQRTSEHVTFLVYRDKNGAYELFDDRETDHDHIAGTEDYVFEEWGTRNRQLISDGFIRDNMRGDNKWQQFIS
jgi:hypothetical protein